MKMVKCDVKTLSKWLKKVHLSSKLWLKDCCTMHLVITVASIYKHTQKQNYCLDPFALVRPSNFSLSFSLLLVNNGIKHGFKTDATF